MLIMFAALQSIPEYVYEAGRMDGLSETQMLWRITLPLLEARHWWWSSSSAWTDRSRSLELVYM